MQNVQSLKCNTEGRGEASVYSVTFNMSCGSVPHNVHELVPLGHDLYIIAVQRCVYYEDLRSAILEHLNMGPKNSRRSSKGPFQAFSAAVGTARTAIGESSTTAILICAPVQEVEKGLFYAAALKKDSALGSLSLINLSARKQTVGIPIRYYDTSIAIVTSSFSWDPTASHSKLFHRNREAVDLLSGLHMDVDETEFDFPSMYHHVIILGDLNYVLDPLATESMDMAQLLYNAIELDTQWRESETKLSSLNQARYLFLSPKPQKNPFPGDFIINVDHETTPGTLHYTTADMDDPSDILDDDQEVTVIPLDMIDDDKDYFLLPSMNIDTFVKDSKSPITLRSFTADKFVEDHSSSITEASDDWICNADANFKAMLEKTLRLYDQREEAWRKLVAYDQLLDQIGRGDIFAGFTEGHITFPPSFRYRLGHQRLNEICPTLEEFKKAINLEVVGQVEPRFISYSDRIIYHSLDDMRSRMRVKSYSLLHNISTSDHKPVACVFELDVNRLFAPHSTYPFSSNPLSRALGSGYESSDPAQEPQIQSVDQSLKLHKSPGIEMKEVFLFHIRLDNLQAEFWRRIRSDNRRLALSDGSRPRDPEEDYRLSPDLMFTGQRGDLESLGPSLQSYRQFSMFSAVDSVAIETVVAQFPLPSEDIFSEQRKVYEVATILSDGKTSSGHTNTRIRMPWEEAQDRGILCKAFARCDKGLHVVLKLLGRDGEDLGHTVIGLQDALDDLASREAEHLQSPVEFRQSHGIQVRGVLAKGGQKVGNLLATVRLSIRKEERDERLSCQTQHRASSPV